MNSTGRLDLVGADDKVITVHSDQCSSCSLIPAARGAAPANGMECKSCGSAGRSVPMAVCDKCGNIWHTTCVRGGAMQLDPYEAWLCPEFQP
jgi:hypothetical protein